MNKYERKHKNVLSDINSGKRVSPLKAIRAFCLECVGYSADEVRLCTAGDSCPLFKFRFGKNKTGKNNASQVPDEKPKGVKNTRSVES